MALDQSAVSAGSLPATSFSTSNLSVPRGLGIHFDPSAPGSAVAEPPASQPGPSATPAVPPAPPADGSAAASPAAPREDVGLRQLREQYEATKGKLEPWEKIGAKPEEVSQHYPLVVKMRTEAMELAERLGYDPKEAQEFFLKDPVQLLQYLRQQMQTQQPGAPNPADVRKQIERMVQEGLKPITEREDSRMNKEAEFRFDGEFDRLFKDNFKDGLPDDAKSAIYEMVGQLVGEDSEAIQRLKFSGQVSDVARYFTQAKDRVMKIYTAMSEHERKRTGGQAATPGTPAAQPKSRLDVKLSTGQTVRDLFNA